MRTSRPAWTANDFSTPSKLSAIACSSSSRLTYVSIDLAAGTRPRRADRVGDLHDRRLDAGVLDLLVVRGDGVDHLHRQVVALGDLGADRRVRALDLVVDRLADVVQQAAHLGDLDVGADLGRDDRREARSSRSSA